MSQISCSHSPTYNDRQWKIECKAFETTEDCSWTGFHNLYETELNFNCPANHVITGIFSDFSIQHGGRKWNFRCCSAPNFTTFECRDTPMVNYWDEDFIWHIPGDNFLTGVHTHNKNNNGDHRWSFSYCRGTTEDFPTVTSKILAANTEVESELIEGDIVVSKTRNAAVCSNCRWPKSGQTVNVPYEVHRQFSRSEERIIDKAIEGFELNTCVRFVPRSGRNKRNYNDYISIVKGQGCWSYIGRIGGSQQLSVGNGCVYNGIIQHELLHALSFWHEQSRSDRDIYVKINYENIISNLEHNFNKQNTNNLNAPYDYGSVMHYGAKDFSKNGQDTITALDASAVIGQRAGMSDTDILMLNRLYGCTDYLRTSLNSNINGNWDNEFNGTLSHQCPSGQAVSSITSEYGVINFWQEYFSWPVPSSNFLTGVKSSFDSNSHDRRWSFSYCQGKTQ
ncbi:High choriolytic enzyme 1 [Larimichthys crocea]|uniref:Metalloendopeptidase n=1 Tax=Larimichthys crocea TaxID=215358 RepID=A0A6G0J5X3_LARCR|nr:High choriolytic enzyme 1 [Larimichthys crocea]